MTRRITFALGSIDVKYIAFTIGLKIVEAIANGLTWLANRIT